MGRVFWEFYDINIVGELIEWSGGVVVGGVVVLGKFDVLYVGYCVLVECVVEFGVLFLVLFVGMV